MRRLVSVVIALQLFTVQLASAEGIRVFVRDFAVTGAVNAEAMKAALPALLATRLDGAGIKTVGSAAEATIQVAGHYTVVGESFSIDVTALDQAGKIVARTFEEGDKSQNLLQSMGKVAQSLARGLLQSPSPAIIAESPQPKAVAPVPLVPPVVMSVAAPAAMSAPSDIVRVSTDATVPQQVTRIPGELIGVALLRNLGDGGRELYVIGKHRLAVVRQNVTLQVVAEEQFGVAQDIVSVDSADLDGDGLLEAYLTILVEGKLASQVWQYTDKGLRRIAADLPYYFRKLAVAGGNEKLFVQERGLETDFYGGVAELVKDGTSYVTRNPFNLPKYGTLYSFNQLKDKAGSSFTVVFNPDRYMVITNDKNEELWRSSDKYGGTELTIPRAIIGSLPAGTRKVTFLQQRLTVTQNNAIIVPQNAGGWQIGDSHSYNKNMLFSFAWNGSSLVEQWHTKESQNYLADYFFDESRKELVLLEIVQKEGLISKGASTITVKKVD